MWSLLVHTHMVRLTCADTNSGCTVVACTPAWCRRILIASLTFMNSVDVTVALSTTCTVATAVSLVSCHTWKSWMPSTFSHLNSVRIFQVIWFIWFIWMIQVILRCIRVKMVIWF